MHHSRRATVAASAVCGTICAAAGSGPTGSQPEVAQKRVIQVRGLAGLRARSSTGRATRLFDYIKPRATSSARSTPSGGFAEPYSRLARERTSRRRVDRRPRGPAFSAWSSTTTAAQSRSLRMT